MAIQRVSVSWGRGRWVLRGDRSLLDPRLPCRGPRQGKAPGNPDLGSPTGHPLWHSPRAGAPNLTLLQLPFSFGVFNGKQRLQKDLGLDGCFCYDIDE